MPRHAKRPVQPSPTPEMSRPVLVARLGDTESHSFTETATEDELRALARLFDARSVDKFRFTATLTPLGRAGWQLDGRLEATIIQNCVVTLAPVTARISEPMHRRFLPEDVPATDLDPEEEDDTDPLGDRIDLGGVAIETAALALDPYPRAEGAEEEAERLLSRAAPGPDDVAPRENPFARLAELKQKLDGEP